MKIKLLATALAAALLFGGCLGLNPNSAGQQSAPAATQGVATPAAENPEYPVELFGVELVSRPGSVVSLSPALTERLYELGLEGRLEGVSDYDDYPENRVACGTAQAPDIEAIKEISPHLLLTETALREDDAYALSEAGVKTAVIPHAGSFAELLSQYQSLAMLMDGKKTGASLGGAYCNRLDERMRELERNALESPKVAVYLTRLDYNMATGDTLEGELLEKLGFVNVAKAQKNWVYPEDAANSEEGRAAFNQIEFIFCDRDSVTMPMMEKSEFWRGLTCVIKDYYLYVDETAFDRQTGRMLDELERMLGYAKGEIEGGAIQEQQQTEQEPEE